MPLTAIAPAAAPPLEGAALPLPAFAEAMPCAIAVLAGPGRRILAANAAWCRLAGVATGAELVGRALGEFFPLGEFPLGEDGESMLSRRAIPAAIPPGGAATWWDLDLVPYPGMEGVLLATAREVTEHVLALREAEEAREALAATAERLRLAQEVAGVGTWEWDLGLDRQAWSPEQFRLCGLDPMRDTPPSFEAWLRMVHPEDRARLAAAAESGFRDTRGLYHLEFRLRRADTGEERWLLAHGRVVAEGPDGRPARMLGVNLDITDRRAELAVVREREQFLMRRARDIVLVLRPTDGTILEANDAAAAAYGHPREALAGMRVHALRAPETRGGVDVQLAQAERRGVLFETLHQRRDGTTFPVEVSAIGSEAGGERITVSIIRDISERRAAEATLAASEARLRAMVEALPVVTWVLRPDGTAEFFNRLFREYLGAEPDPGLGGRVLAVHPEEREAFLAARGEALAAGREFEAECRVRRHDGAWRWHRVRIVPVRRAAQGAPDFLLGTAVDIHDLRTTAERVAAQERLLRTAQEAAGVGVFERDLATEHATWSPGMFRLYGLDPAAGGDASITREAFLAMIDPRDRERHLAARAANAASDAGRFAFEFRIRRADTGEARWIASRGEIERDPATGRALRAIGVNYDVTEAREAAAALAEGETRLRLALEASGMGGWEIDISGAAPRLTREDGLHRLCGLPPGLGEDAVAAHAALIHPEDRPLRDAALRRAIHGEEDEYRAEYRFRRADTGEERWMAVRGRVLRGADGRPARLIGISQDVTERRAAAEAERRAAGMLRRLMDSDLLGITVCEGEAVLEANDAYLRLVGLTRAEFETGGLSWSALTPPEYVARDAAVLRELRETGRAPAYEKEYLRPDGTRVPLLVGGALLDAATGRRLVFCLDLSARRAAEAAAREALAELAVLYDTAPVGLCVLDAEMRYTRINARLAEINGLPAEGHIGRTVREVVPGIAEAAEALHRRVMQTGEAALGIEITGETPAQPGVTRVWDEDWLPLRDAEGRVTGVSIVAEEVTERRAAERALAESERRLNAVLDNASVAIFLMDERQHCAYMNAAAERLTGYTLAEVQGRPLHEVVHHTRPDGNPYPLAECPIDRAFPEHRHMQGEEVFVHRDGSFYPVAFTASPIHGEDARVVGTIVEVRDIRAEKAAQAALAESEARFRDMADNAPVMVWVTDAAGSCTYLSRSWHEFTGQTPEAGLGLGWVEATHPEDRDRVRESFLTATARQGPFRVEYRLRRADGAYRWAIDTAVPRFGPDGGFLGYIGSVIDITERKATEAALAEGEARLQLALSTAALGVVVWDLEAGTMRADAGAEAISRGLLPAGRPLRLDGPERAGWRARTHPGDLPRREALRAELVAGGKAGVQDEYRVRLPGAAGEEWAWIATRSAVVARDGATGRALRVLDVVQDVTPRRQAEAALRESEGRLRRVQRIGRVGGFEIDLRTGVNRRSAEYMALQGQTAQAALERHADWLRRLYPEDRERAERRFLEVIADGAPDTDYAQEYRILTPAGEVRWIAARAEIERDAAGRALRMLGAHVDVTELKLAEAAVAESEARFRTLADAMPQLVWTASAEGAVTYRNARHRDYAGLHATAEGGWRWQPVLHPDDLLPTEAAWRRAQQAGTTYEVEHRLQLADGGWRWHISRAEPVRDAAGRITAWYGTATDIDARKRAEEALARANEALEARVAERTRALSDAAQELAAEMRRREAAQAALLQSQKLEALGQLTGGVAHDFNNILAAITGSYRLIERRVQDPQVVELIRHGERAAERARRLIRQLLAFARKERLSPAALDPAEALHEAEDLVCHAAGSRIRCRLEAPPGLWRVLADPHQLEIALLNLVVNARDAMPGGGELTIGVRNLEAAERPPRLRPGDYVGIAVQDNGEGMAPEVLARATEPFFTTKPTGKGTGLGLAMVHGFAEQSGGCLVIESRPGEGTRVEIILPRAALDELAPAAAVPEALAPEAGRHGGAMILLVEDDDQVRPVTAGFLRELGYGVAEAANAEAAGALIHTLERVDLVVTDVAMPGADGPTLAARLRAERPGLPILFVTGHPPGPALAGEAVLRKPYTGAEFGAAVLERLGRRPPPSADRVLARLRSPALRELYLAWAAARAAGEAPPPTTIDPARFGLAGSAFTVAVDATADPPGFQLISAAPALEGRLEALRGGAAPAGEEVLGSLEGACRRCLRSRAPVYQAARFDFGDGAPLQAERLLLPMSGNGQTVTSLLGIMLSDPLRTAQEGGADGRRA